MTTPDPDGFLPAALRRLADVVADLIDPLPQSLDNEVHFADSRYQQLGQAIYGQRDVRSNGGSSAPIWTDALDLMCEINAGVASWCRRPSIKALEERLADMLAHGWRPQDVRLIDDHSGDLERWAKRIDALLSENGVMELDAACPACGVRTVQRERAGEMVRLSALQVDAQGCRCLDCRTEWAPQYFMHLARVIGCPPPVGILE